MFAIFVVTPHLLCLICLIMLNVTLNSHVIHVYLLMVTYLWILLDAGPKRPLGPDLLDLADSSWCLLHGQGEWLYIET